MTKKIKLNKKTYAYIFLIFTIAILLFTYLFLEFEMPSWELILFWGIIAILAETLPITLPNGSIAVSVGSAINLAAIIVGGPLLGTIVYSMAFLFRCPYIPPRKSYRHIFNTPYYMTVFNVSQAAIVSSVMGLIYVYTGGRVGEFFPLQTIYMLVFGTILNTIIISKLMNLLQGEDFVKVWQNNIRGLIWNVLGIGTMGIIIALSFLGYGYWAVVLFFGPLLLARYSFKLYVEMRNFNIATIQTLGKTLEARDPYTSGHSARVEEYAIKLAKAYGLSEKKIENIKTAAILHDIGKIGIKDSILNKTDKLTQDEFAEIMAHPGIGADIIKKLDIFREITPIIRYHHERYDGTGYPEGLKGDEIPLEACILAIADAFDAMTSDRPYRDALKKEIALEEIKENAGTQFHPKLAKKFVAVMREGGH